MTKLLYIPLAGIAIFIALYLYAVTLYPGGSQADLGTVGFDWLNNYWCDLLNKETDNGVENPARPIAIAATIILSTSLMAFFLLFAKNFIVEGWWQRTFMTSGVLAMGFISLIFTNFHNTAIVIASFFGLFVAVGLVKAIYNSNQVLYKFLGVLCVILIAVNNYIYYSKHLIVALPLLQKVMIGSILLLVAGINLGMIKENRSR